MVTIIFRSRLLICRDKSRLTRAGYRPAAMFNEVEVKRKAGEKGACLSLNYKSDGHSRGNAYMHNFRSISLRECAYEISPSIFLIVRYILHLGDLNSGQCERYMLLCNSHSNAGNVRGRFGKDLHGDGRENAVRELNWIKLNLFPGGKKRRI